VRGNDYFREMLEFRYYVKYGGIDFLHSMEEGRMGFIPKVIKKVIERFQRRHSFLDNGTNLPVSTCTCFALSGLTLQIFP